jgi:pimeloyl-ACP methyl ester carboxylesterase
VRRYGALGLVVLATALLYPAADSHAAFPGPATSGDFAGLVTIPDGRRLYLECHGSGSPTVILESGLRARGDFWDYSRSGEPGTGVFSMLTPFTRTCIYDRPGTLLSVNQTSRSDPVPMPRTTGEAATDLHELLLAAGVPGPYVLAGGSTGGLIVRQFDSRYPKDVAGMVLVDAISEAVQGLMKAAQFARYNQFYLQSPGPAASRYPDLEAIDFYRSFAQMRRKRRPPRPIPIVVISSDLGFGRQPGVTTGFARFVNRVWKRAQRYLASLEPGIKRVVAVDSGHLININQPELVTKMIEKDVAAVRSGHRLVPKR